MKTILTLAILLFVYPWDKTANQDGKLLFEGMYTITGRSYNELNVYEGASGCQAVYVKAYEQRLIITMSEYGTGRYTDVVYPFEGLDASGVRVYRNNTQSYLVDKDYNMQRVYTTTTYNGNRTITTYCEMIKGDHSQDCLKRLEGELERERMKTTIDY